MWVGSLGGRTPNRLKKSVRAHVPSPGSLGSPLRATTPSLRCSKRSQSALEKHTHDLIYELFVISPTTLFYVLPNFESELKARPLPPSPTALFRLRLPL